MNPALHPCPACKREVSRKAASCPQCGHVFKTQHSIVRVLFLLVLVPLLLVAAAKIYELFVPMK